MNKTAIKKQIGPLVFILSFLMVLCCLAEAKPIDNKAISAIKNFIASQNPRLSSSDIKVTFKTKSKGLDELLENKSIALKVPDSFRVTKITPQMLVPLSVTENGKDEGTIVLSVRVEIFKKIFIAKNDIEKNSVIGEEDVEAVNKEVTILPPYYVTKIDEVVSRTAKIKIPQGSIIYSTMVKLPPIVQKGDPIKIQSSGENVLVEVQGTALEDGQVGETIRVRPNDSKDTLSAQVIKPGMVEVK